MLRPAKPEVALKNLINQDPLLVSIERPEPWSPVPAK